VLLRLVIRAFGYFIMFYLIVFFLFIFLYIYFNMFKVKNINKNVIYDIYK
jgi:hypothetical protein